MSHIVSPQRYPTKKAFKQAVIDNPESVYVTDPSAFNPVSGYLSTVMGMKQVITVTNHPRRSWFAEITNKNGNIIVK